MEIGDAITECNNKEIVEEVLFMPYIFGVNFFLLGSSSSRRSRSRVDIRNFD